MLPRVQSAGCRPPFSAAFSAGRPKASNPIGNSTFQPRIRKYRASVSDGAMANQWPTCRSPEGYGNIVKW